MKQFTFITSLFLSSSLFSAIEILDRVAVIVDDGVIMESQINSGLENMITRYKDQNIPRPPMESLREQVIESLIVEELQLQLANRAGVRISDAELNDAITRIAANNEMGLEQFIDYIVKDGESYEDFRENVKKTSLNRGYEGKRQGKMTIARALDSDNVRVRSLA